MIQDGIDYGEGFCRADEPGPDVEWRTTGGWQKRMYPCNALELGAIYRQPIKPKPITLQTGESYRMRNGEIVGPIQERIRVYEPVYKFEMPGGGESWTASGKWRDDCSESDFDLVEHITTEDKRMTFEEWFQSHEDGEWKSTRQSLAQQAYEAGLKSGEVAKKMREDIEINAGDFVMAFDYIRKVKMVKDHSCYFHNSTASSYVQSNLCTKITNPAHIQALTEIYEGMK